MDFEKMLEKELERNAELRRVFEEHPERKALYIEKLRDTWGERTGRPQNQRAKACQDCMFAHGDPPFADTPNKAYCEMYPKGSSGKPHDIYFNGGFCELYEKEE